MALKEDKLTLYQGQLYYEPAPGMRQHTQSPYAERLLLALEGIQQGQQQSTQAVQDLYERVLEQERQLAQLQRVQQSAYAPVVQPQQIEVVHRYEPAPPPTTSPQPVLVEHRHSYSNGFLESLGVAVIFTSLLLLFGVFCVGLSGLTQRPATTIIERGN